MLDERVSRAAEHGLAPRCVPEAANHQQVGVLEDGRISTGHTAAAGCGADYRRL